MKAIVEVLSGSQAGQRFVLRPPQQLRFGRTIQADASFPDDEKMSSMHFQITADEKACYLQDLGSTNGTQVNGEKADSVVLRDGDLLISGQTQFRVAIQGDRSEDVAPLAPVKIPAAQKERNTPQTIEQTPIRFVSEDCASGITMCEGSVEEVSAPSLTERLRPHKPAYLILNFRLLELSPKEELEEPEYLYNWLESETQEYASPVVIAAASVEKWSEYLQAAWGLDAAVVLFSEDDFETVLGHLRSVTKGESRAGRGALGISWPSVTQEMLRCCEPSLAQKVLGGMDAVLMETGEEAEKWLLAGQKSLPELLRQQGMIEVEVEDLDDAEQAAPTSS